MSEFDSNLTLELFRRSWRTGDWCDVTTLVGVSGGADSVALLRLMSSLRAESPGKGRLLVAHFDHLWRDDSALDAKFVVRLAETLDLQCVVGVAAAEAAIECAIEAAIECADGVARSPAQTEERAREMRYAFLTRTAKQYGARFIATGHTADDQVETILHHAIRGSGLRGLGGIRPSRMIDESLTLIRPLLGFRRAHLVDYLRALGQAFRVDPSNEDLSYTRSRIRHELLPLLRTYNSEVEESLLRLGSLAAETSTETSRLAKEVLREALISSTSTSAVVAIPALVNASPLIVRELFVELWRQQDWPLKAMSFQKWESLSRLVHGDTASGEATLNLPGNVHVRCRPGSQVELRRKND